MTKNSGMIKAFSFPESVCVLVGMMMSAAGVCGQQVEQNIRLEKGWNAVFFEVDPEPPDAVVVFAGLNVRSVWVMDPAHVNRASDCPDGSDCLTATSTGWRVWFPPDVPQHVISSLRVLRGGRSYMIEMGGPADLVLRGPPNSAVTGWRRGFNLTGFHVVSDPSATPTFADYLAPSAAHRGVAVFQLESDGTLTQVQTETQRIVPHEAYWVEAQKHAVYDGPLRIDARSLRGVDLLGGMTEHRLGIENLVDGATQVTLLDESSDSGIPLVWYEFADGGDAAWRDLNSVQVGLERKGQPGSKRYLRLSARRQAHSEPDPEAGLGRDSGLGVYGGVLAVIDGKGFRRFVPYRGSGASQNGLWVGDVTINEVFPINLRLIGTAASSEFSIRIIIHKSETESRLLSDVVLAHQGDGIYALVTSACPDFDGLLDGSQISPRVSSSNFSFDGDVILTGTFPVDLTANITVASDHALNPFKHRDNPLHATGIDVTRVITLTFDPDGGGDPAWGVTRLAGTYAEIVTGLYKNDLQARGRFELRRVSTIETLCGAP